MNALLGVEARALPATRLGDPTLLYGFLIYFILFTIFLFRRIRRTHRGKLLPPKETMMFPREDSAARARQPALVLRSSLLVASVVLVVNGLWVLTYLATGHQARDFIHIGQEFITRNPTSPVIRFDSTYHGYTRVGYDGQFFYFMALDPVNAWHYIDSPNYRYTRILYPTAARLLAVGRADLVPYTLIAINLLAIAGGTLAVAAWLKRHRFSPWLALLYGFYPGLFVSLQRDLSEPLSFALVAVGIYLFDVGNRQRILWPGIVFALALLAREATAVFPVVYGVTLLFQGEGPPRHRLRVNWPDATSFLALALLPLVSYKAFLLIWLGSLGLRLETIPPFLQSVPFAGILHYWPWDPPHIEQVRSVVFPALICAAMGAWALWRRLWRTEVVALFANVIPFVVLLSSNSYADIYASSRITAGVVMAAILCLPTFRLLSSDRSWFWSSSALWLSLVPFWLLAPIAAYAVKALSA